MTEENKTNQTTPTDAPASSDASQDEPTETTPVETPTEASVEAKTEVPTAAPAEEATTEAKAPDNGKVLPDLRPGMTVRVSQKIKEFNTKGEEKERIQVYEGLIIAMKHGREQGGTITVRKISNGVGVEKIFPIYSPNVVKIEPIKQAQVRRSKLDFLKTWKKKLKETIIKKD